MKRERCILRLIIVMAGIFPRIWNSVKTIERINRYWLNTRMNNIFVILSVSRGMCLSWWGSSLASQITELCALLLLNFL